MDFVFNFGPPDGEHPGTFHVILQTSVKFPRTQLVTIKNKGRGDVGAFATATVTEVDPHSDLGHSAP